MLEWNFTKAAKPPKCAHCGKDKDLHKSHTFECPGGTKTRVGFIHYGPTTYAPKKGKKK